MSPAQAAAPRDPLPRALPGSERPLRLGLFAGLALLILLLATDALATLLVGATPAGLPPFVRRASFLVNSALFGGIVGGIAWLRQGIARDLAELAPALRLRSLTQGTGASERTVAFEYHPDGNLEKVIDPLGREVSFVYDAAGRVDEQTLPGPGDRTIDYGYDARGNLTSLTPPGQPAHVFRYTGRDQEREYEPPALPGIADARTIYTYDAERKLDLVERPDGTTVDPGYDASGRLATITIPRGTITLGYAPDSGHLETLDAPGGEGLALGYDGLFLTDTTWSGTVAGSVSHQLDHDLRLNTQSVNGGFTETFDFDEDGLLTQAGAMTLVPDPVHGLPKDTTDTSAPPAATPPSASSRRRRPPPAPRPSTARATTCATSSGGSRRRPRRSSAGRRPSTSTSTSTTTPGACGRSSRTARSRRPTATTRTGTA